ncbi:c-type cytochrome [Sphaerospermopsis aphanizomenoides BCCUSP55]|uniref:cytochrome c6 PetJ n=1 Tax=Sphaerospermopsis aphanizomenoides TaxID=459663 RepID=UPI00190676B9|nr:c-type cytochrome [Sphaerospermopsis aphanizomenoides]MBK1990699.1 c-type cytochrome [Sphaerospermopsis aphanizomenoides BCCUSP55]
MKRIISVLLLGITIFTFAFTSPALAADTAAGKAVFTANCASCHAGGKNLVNAAKSLSKEDLEEYNIYSEAAIIAQVTNGKNAMPAFKDSLTTDEVANVAAYVMEQAEAGWTK